MSKVIKWLDYAKWYLVAFGLLLLAFVVRAIGASEKQEEYREVFDSFSKKKREELFERHRDLSETIVKGESETIEAKEAEVVSLEREISRRKEEKVEKVNSRETSIRLERMGLK